MSRKVMLYASIALSVSGIAYSARELATPKKVRANDPVCCVSDKQCSGTKCGSSGCNGLKGGGC